MADSKNNIDGQLAELLELSEDEIKKAIETAKNLVSFDGNKALKDLMIQLQSIDPNEESESDSLEITTSDVEETYVKAEQISKESVVPAMPHPPVDVSFKEDEAVFEENTKEQLTDVDPNEISGVFNELRKNEESIDVEENESGVFQEMQLAKKVQPLDDNDAAVFQELRNAAPTKEADDVSAPEFQEPKLEAPLLPNNEDEAPALQELQPAVHIPPAKEDAAPDFQEQPFADETIDEEALHASETSVEVEDDYSYNVELDPAYSAGIDIDEDPKTQIRNVGTDYRLSDGFGASIEHTEIEDEFDLDDESELEELMLDDDDLIEIEEIAEGRVDMQAQEEHPSQALSLPPELGVSPLDADELSGEGNKEDFTHSGLDSFVDAPEEDDFDVDLD